MELLPSIKIAKFDNSAGKVVITGGKGLIISQNERGKRQKE